MKRNGAVVVAALAGLIATTSVVGAQTRLPDIHVAVAAVGSRMPAACKGMNTSGTEDPRFGYTVRFAGELNGKHVATYEVRLALDRACTKATVKAVKRAVHKGLRIAPDRPIAKFSVYGDALMFYVPVIDDAEWKEIGG